MAYGKYGRGSVGLTSVSARAIKAGRCEGKPWDGKVLQRGMLEVALHMDAELGRWITRRERKIFRLGG